MGDYVSWQWDTSVSLGPIWNQDTDDEPATQLYTQATLFAGEPEAPSFAQRVIRITVQPRLLRLRPKEKAPMVVSAHVTDGTATWVVPLEGYKVTSDDQKVAHADGASVIAKQAGRAVLRVEQDGLFAEAVVDIAAHPRGTSTTWIAGLPPISGLAWTEPGLVVSTREAVLRRIGRDGKFTVIAGLPTQPPIYGGSDTLAASSTGDLAVRLQGHRDVLVLRASDDYTSSGWIEPPARGSAVALVWDGPDLVIGSSDGAIQYVSLDGGAARQFAHSAGTPMCIADAEDAFLVLTAGDHRKLWRFPKSDPDKSEVLVDGAGTHDFSSVAYVGGQIYLTTFHGGSLLRFRDGRLETIRAGMQNPTAVTVGSDGTIYVAEFDRGAVRRLLP